MVAYIYIPTAWAFSVILFGATLWNRKLISDATMGGGFAGLVVVTLVSPLLMCTRRMPSHAKT